MVGDWAREVAASDPHVGSFVEDFEFSKNPPRALALKPILRGKP